MDLAELIADKRDEILAIAAKHGAYNVRVFGSVARGDYDDKRSDIDILVCLDSSGLAGMRYFGVLDELNDELEKLLGRKVDLIDEKGLQDPLPEHVLQEAVSL